MNTYYLKKFRKKAKKFLRIQMRYCDILGKDYIVERKENIGVGYTLWHWSKVGFFSKTFEEEKKERSREEKKFILMEVIRVRNKSLAKL